MDQTALLDWGINFKLATGVIGTGWLLELYCHYDNYREGKDKLAHMIKNMIKATFTSVSIVVVLNIAFSLTLNFPDYTRLFKIADGKLDHNGKRTKTANAQLIGLNSKLDSLITSGNRVMDEENKHLQSQIRDSENINGRLRNRLQNQKDNLDYMVRQNTLLRNKSASIPSILIYLDRNGRLNNQTFDSLIQAKFQSYFYLNATLEYEGDGKPIVFTVPEIQDKTFIITMGGKVKGLIQ